MRLALQVKNLEVAAVVLMQLQAGHYWLVEHWDKQEVFRNLLEAKNSWIYLIIVLRIFILIIKKEINQNIWTAILVY